MIAYRPELDGLRAVAVGAVILFHANVPFAHGGFVGVDVFFVLSGYLITSILMADLKVGTFSILAFYDRRIRRIVPAMVCVVGASLLPAWLLMTPKELTSFGSSVLSVPVFATNFWFAWSADYFAPAAETLPLLHLWSLAVEEQFYIVFPIVLAWATRTFSSLWSVLLGMVCIALASFASAVFLQGMDIGNPFFMPHTRAWELLAGAIVALAKDASAARDGVDDAWSRLLWSYGSPIGALAIAAAVVGFDRTTPSPGMWILLPVAGALLIIAAPEGGLAGRVLRIPALVKVGLISYSLYLWHFPVFAFARIALGGEPSPGAKAQLVALVVALSVASWLTVERPFRSRHRLTTRWVMALALLFGTSLFLAGGILYWFNGFPYRTPLPVRSILAHSSKEAQKLAFSNVEGDTCTVQCRIGARDVAPTVLFAGDSHTSMLARAADEEFKRRGLAGVMRADLSFHLNAYPAWYPHLDELRKSQEAVHAIIADPSIETVVMSSRFTFKFTATEFDNGEGGAQHYNRPPFSEEATTELRTRLHESILGLLDKGKKVVFVEPIPETGWLIPEYLARSYAQNGHLSPSQGSTSYQRYLERNRMVLAFAKDFETRPGFTLFPTSSLFCNTQIKDRCITHSDGVPLYMDANHLSLPSARRLMSELVQAILKRN